MNFNTFVLPFLAEPTNLTCFELVWVSLISFKFNFPVVPFIDQDTKEEGQTKRYTSNASHSSATGIVQLPTVSYWAAQKGTTVPHIWQLPQTTQLAAGIWPNC